MTTQQRISRLEKELGKLRMESSDWVSEKDAALLLGIQHDTLRRLRREGKIKGWECRVSGRGYRYKRSELTRQFIRQ